MGFAEEGNRAIMNKTSLPTRSVFGILAALSLAACFDSGDSHAGSGLHLDLGDPFSGSITVPKGCELVGTTGSVVQLKADGTLDTTAAQIWPDRIDEGAPLSADEHTQACALLAACKEPTNEENRAVDFEVCLLGFGSSNLSWEERAVPLSGTTVRWAIKAREILGAKGFCQAVNQIEQTRDSEAPTCQEDGCTVSCVAPGTISCQDNVASFQNQAGSPHFRDCALSLTACDASSPTGCTDRPLVACTHPAVDSCDGNIRLGCDGTGRVSFHDCARLPGGTCQTIGGVGRCVVPDAGECNEDPAAILDSPCEGNTMIACFQGKKRPIACADLGLSACVGTTCVP